MPTEILLLHPPATKPAEPPLGTAILAGHLRAQGFNVAQLDANLGACLWFLDPQRAAAAAGPTPPTATRRALGAGPRALQLLRSPQGAGSFPRYATAVRALHTLLGLYGADGERLTLGDYEHPTLSPFVPEDLAALASGAARTLFADYFTREVVPQVVARQPRLIAVSINFRQQVLPAIELAGLLRRALPQATLVAGGGMITSWRGALQEGGLRLPPFDHLVCGPGEEPLTRLTQGTTAVDLLAGRELAFTPDFTDVPLDDYLSPQRVLPLVAGRGCYWNRCRFCPEAATPPHPFACAPPATFPDQLRTLADRYDVRHFHLTDNAIPPATLRALAAAGESLSGLRWHGFVRFERDLLDADLVAALARSGCALLQLGLESGSQRVLDAMAKGTRLEEVSVILRHLRQAGIATYVYVMVGIPGETAADVALTRRFLCEHSDAIDYLNLALMNLPRDAGLLAAAEDYGIAASALHADDAPLGLYRRFTPTTGLGRGEARRLLGELRQEPLLRPILQRTPPWFTSHHAFFFPPRG